jgi:hypothetical protein
VNTGVNCSNDDDYVPLAGIQYNKVTSEEATAQKKKSTSKLTASQQQSQ